MLLINLYLRGITSISKFLREDEAENLSESSMEYLDKLDGRVRRMDMLLKPTCRSRRARRQMGSIAVRSCFLSANCKLVYSRHSRIASVCWRTAAPLRCEYAPNRQTVGSSQIRGPAVICPCQRVRRYAWFGPLLARPVAACSPMRPIRLRDPRTG